MDWALRPSGASWPPGAGPCPSWRESVRRHGGSALLNCVSPLLVVEKKVVLELGWKFVGKHCEGTQAGTQWPLTFFFFPSTL